MSGGNLRSAAVRLAVHEARQRLTVSRAEVQMALREGRIDATTGILLLDQLDAASAAMDTLVEATGGPPPTA